MTRPVSAFFAGVVSLFLLIVTAPFKWLFGLDPTGGILSIVALMVAAVMLFGAGASVREVWREIEYAHKHEGSDWSGAKDVSRMFREREQQVHEECDLSDPPCETAAK